MTQDKRRQRGFSRRKFMQTAAAGAAGGGGRRRPVQRTASHAPATRIRATSRMRRFMV